MPKKPRRIRYAVVGLGHISQKAVLPAFKNAANSELTTLVSDTPEKLRALGQKYRTDQLFSYDGFEDCLASGLVDAVYIATPNSTHRRFTEIAASYGVHVLCEKPMATSVKDCRSMIESARNHGIKLMVAYRLHFDPANLKAIEIATSGKLGELKIFSSVFAMQVRDVDNIRLQRDLGGGTLYDLGIYCINAARNLFQSEPIAVYASAIQPGGSRFTEVDEMTSAVLTFPEGKLATLTSSFGVYDSDSFELVGESGRLQLENAFEYTEPMHMTISVNGRTLSRSFAKHDQFGAELVYFSDCILQNRQPEPSGIEGLADLRVIEALLESAEIGHPVSLGEFRRSLRPSRKQQITRPAIRPPEEILANSPHRA